jgi:hypothetical protein
MCFVPGKDQSAIETSVPVPSQLNRELTRFHCSTPRRVPVRGASSAGTSWQILLSCQFCCVVHWGKAVVAGAPAIITFNRNRDRIAVGMQSFGPFTSAHYMFDHKGNAEANHRSFRSASDPLTLVFTGGNWLATYFCYFNFDHFKKFMIARAFCFPFTDDLVESGLDTNNLGLRRENDFSLRIGG